MAEWRPSGRWVIVAGQGTYELTDPQQWTSRELGRALADAGHGLVTGKWAGVDYLVAESYANRLREHQVEPSRFLIQVVPPRWSGGYAGGLVVETAGDRAEYVEKMKHPGPVVLIGGMGATYDTYRVGEAHRKPVLPVGGTGGDAARAHAEIVKYWSFSQPRGMSLDAFRRLGREIGSPAEARAVVADLVAAIAQSFVGEGPGQVFVSYAREDRVWATNLREFLAPVVRMGLLSVWDDSRIEPGRAWEDEIRRAIESSRSAVLLVSTHFLASDFIMSVEFPLIRSLARDRRLTIDWICVSACRYQHHLGDLQAVHDVATPIDSLSPAEQNAFWVRVVDLIEAQMTGTSSRGSA